MPKQLKKQLSLGVDPYTGKRIRKWVYADSPGGLKKAEKEAQKAFDKTGIQSSMTFREYKDRWYASCSHLSPATLSTYKHILNKLKALEPIRMDKILRSDLQKILNDNWHHPPMCNYIAFIMTSIFKAAAFDGVIGKNIAEGLKKPKKAKSERRRALTKEELEGVRKADLNVQERFMTDLLLQFGLRPGEAFALDRRSFDRKARNLTISKNLTHQGETPVIKSTKTVVTRVLPVPDSFWEKIPKTNTLYFFTNDDGQLYTRAQVEDFKESVLKKINLAMGGTDQIKVTPMTFYFFRHNKATLLFYESSISTKAKAAYLGHSEIEFLRTYSHLDMEKESVEVLRKAVI